MALRHTGPGDPLNVQPLGSQLTATKTWALFKSRDLEVIRLVLAAGKALPRHQVPGEITIHCLEGRLRIELDEHSKTLNAGELLFLDRNAPHAVTALADASALVTIALRPTAAPC
ncbi:MAG TPA: cupin domain-containing protein [Burkholderiaceae bacterium]